MAALLVLEGMLRTERLRPWWRLWAFPAPMPSAAGAPSMLARVIEGCKKSLKDGSVEVCWMCGALPLRACLE